MTSPKRMLDYIYEHEKNLANQVYLTQPVGKGKVVDYTWGQTMDQARRMAAHLHGLGLAPGARIGILSKNCAHFFMTELAIWMAGYTTVAIFPTESASTVRFVLEHSEASLLFVGKLDTWPEQEPGVPADMPRIAFPLAPATPYDTWDAITARTAPIAGFPQRAGTDLAMLIYTSGSTGQPKGVMHSFERITASTELSVSQNMGGVVTPGRSIASCPTCRWRMCLSVQWWNAIALWWARYTSFLPSRSTLLPPTCSAHGPHCLCRCRVCGSSSNRRFLQKCRRANWRFCCAFPSSTK